CADRRGRAEQTGVAGHAAERRRVVVVNLADQPPATPRVDVHRFGRRGKSPQPRRHRVDKTWVTVFRITVRPKPATTGLIFRTTIERLGSGRLWPDHDP